jgi:hypothetical protein
MEKNYEKSGKGGDHGEAPRPEGDGDEREARRPRVCAPQGVPVLRRQDHRRLQEDQSTLKYS